MRHHRTTEELLERARRVIAERRRAIEIFEFAKEKLWQVQTEFHLGHSFATYRTISPTLERKRL
jgi:hypothetical protein